MEITHISINVTYSSNFNHKTIISPSEAKRKHGHLLTELFGSNLKLKMQEEPSYWPRLLELKKELRKIRDLGLAEHGAPS